MKLPCLPSEGFDRVLQCLLNKRGMDVDDAIDWIEDHYTIENANSNR